MTSPHEIALLRIVAQRLVASDDVATSAAVSHLLAVQAQDLPGALTSIALRTRGGTADDVRAAFDARVLARTWPMRGTLHVVGVEDLRWMLELMTARPLAAAARRRTQLGLSDDDVALAHRRVERALGGGPGMLRADVLRVWEEAGVPTSGGRGYHLLAHLAQTGVVCLGPMVEREQAFVLVEEWLPQTRHLGREEALARLALRYVRGHGPATEQDLARWAGLPLRDVRTGLAAVGDRLVSVESDGVRYHLDPAVPDLLAQHRTRARGTFLLPGFDELVLGYADRSATVPTEFADRIVPGGNGVFRPTVVHDGRAVGVWHATRARAGRRGGVVAQPFEEFAPEVVDAIPHLAAALP